MGWRNSKSIIYREVMIQHSGRRLGERRLLRVTHTGEIQNVLRIVERGAIVIRGKYWSSEVIISVVILIIYRHVCR